MLDSAPGEGNHMTSTALFLAGIGLMLTGITLLSDALKRMGSRAFRRLASKYMEPRWKALSLGVVSGATLQSTSAAIFILASLTTTGIVGTSQAISILTGFNIGNCIMPFLVSFKIRTAVFFLVGLSAILLYFVKEERWQNIGGTLFGLGLIFFGIEMMLDGVRPLRNEPIFGRILALSATWPGVSIAVGAMLGFLFQSSTSVTVLVIGLAKGGIIPGSDVFPIMYGAAAGSALFKSMLGSTLKGTGRQMARFTNIYNLTGSALFILLHFMETGLGIPLVMAAVARISDDQAAQAAWGFLFLNLAPGIIYIVFHRQVTATLARRYPSSEEETLSRPFFLQGGRPEDPATALELVECEQLRAFEHVAALVVAPGMPGSDPVSVDSHPGSDPKRTRRPVEATLEQRQAAFGQLSQEIEAALAEIAVIPLDDSCAQALAVAGTRQSLLAELSESTAGLAAAIREARRHPQTARLAAACAESADFLYQNVLELFRTQATDEASGTGTEEILYGDRGPQMRQLRESYLVAGESWPKEARSVLLSLTLGMDRCIWLLGRFRSTR